MAAQRSSPIILILIIIAGFVMGYFYESQIDHAGDVPVLNPAFALSSMKGLENFSIDFSILQSTNFRALKVFGELPVTVGATGKSNPFQ